MEAPGHNLIPPIEVAIILAASYHGLLNQAKVAAFSSSLHGLSQAPCDPADVIVLFLQLEDMYLFLSLVTYMVVEVRFIN